MASELLIENRQSVATELAKGMEMGLAEDLSDVALTFECPDCSHPAVRKGSALRTIPHFKCDGCNAKVRITYPQKLAIFEKHRLLAAGDRRQRGQEHYGARNIDRAADAAEVASRPLPRAATRA
ncbi:hypothetical protein [Mesorhizobium sp.]|uniref:hypothetical protein n=1 Tax=Mesorhizobium sp. TaxID=1871066 RepID=UPI0025EF3327|nr:hypothetical protein [Mesorhizobium sp.]